MQKIIKAKLKGVTGTTRCSIDVTELEEALNEGWKVVSATPVIYTNTASFTETIEIVYILEK